MQNTLSENTILVGPDGKVQKIVKQTTRNIGRDAIIVKRLGTEFQSNMGSLDRSNGELIGTLVEVTHGLTVREQRDYAALFDTMNPSEADLINHGFGSFKMVPIV